jgi:hypothetical protein
MAAKRTRRPPVDAAPATEPRKAAAIDETRANPDAADGWEDIEGPGQIGAPRQRVHVSREAERASARAPREPKEFFSFESLQLEAPAPRPGMRQRWVRFDTGDTRDAMNFARKRREGWEPRPSETLPEGFASLKMEQGKLAGFVGVGGNVLCEMPEELVERRTVALRRLTESQQKGVESELKKVERPGISKFQRKMDRQVTFGSRRRPPVAA